MKAISLWQPWATYIAAGMKRCETRSWGTRYRGPLAINAAKRKPTEGERQLLEDWPLEGDVPLGAIVATCWLVGCFEMTNSVIAAQDCRELELGDWYSGRFAWALDRVQPLPAPIPWRGAQGLFEIPDSVLGL